MASASELSRIPEKNPNIGMLLILTGRTEVGKALSEPFSTNVHVGDTMQWEAATDSTLQIYEICIPPYEEGRFENISQ